ncbi:hypothetical protein M3Y95_00008500 [Aphelenchoides besseyi]|nr:hypothetical protein M3Y95_00008500 [Aphelenchoides besseyi]
MAQLIRIKMINEEVAFNLSENTITKSSITSAFLLPNDATVSLSYDLNDRRIWCFFLSNQTYLLDYQYQSPAGNKRSINSYYPALVPDPAPSFETYTKWLYSLNEHNIKTNVICVHPRFFVTFRHGSHKNLNIGNKYGIKVSVAQIHETFDFILLKSESDVVDRGPSIAQAQQSEPFTLAGFGNQHGSVSYLPGSIHSVNDFYVNSDGNALTMGPFILGTSGNSKDCIDEHPGLSSISDKSTDSLKNPPNCPRSRTDGEAAVNSTKNVITPAFRFKDAFLVELRQEKLQEKEPLPSKRIHYSRDVCWQ